MVAGRLWDGDSASGGQSVLRTVCQLIGMPVSLLSFFFIFTHIRHGHIDSLYIYHVHNDRIPVS